MHGGKEETLFGARPHGTLAHNRLRRHASPVARHARGASSPPFRATGQQKGGDHRTNAATLPTAAGLGNRHRPPSGPLGNVPAAQRQSHHDETGNDASKIKQDLGNMVISTTESSDSQPEEGLGVANALPPRRNRDCKSPISESSRLLEARRALDSAITRLTALRNDLKSLVHVTPDEEIPNSQTCNLSVASIAVFETILNRVQDNCGL